MASVKKIARKAAARAGIGMIRHVPEARQLQFLSMLKPITTEHALIRLGGDSDGGYLVPDDLDGIVACFSPGVDKVATFERDLVDRGIRTFQIDATVEESPLKHPLNEFEPKLLGIETRGDYITLDDWVAEKSPTAEGDLMLQMDIEGHEWLALANVSDEVLRRFRIIVIELHSLNMTSLGLERWIFQPVMDKILHRFDIVHLHANNRAELQRSRDVAMTSLLEVTLLRKDRIKERRAAPKLPHSLDRDNLPGRPPVQLPDFLRA